MGEDIHHLVSEPTVMAKPFTRDDRGEELDKEVAHIKVVLDQHSEQLNRLEDNLKLLPGLIADVAFLRSLYEPSPGSNPDPPSTSDKKRKAPTSLPLDPALKTFDSHIVSSLGDSPRPFGQADDRRFTRFLRPNHRRGEEAAEHLGDGGHVGLGHLIPPPFGDRHSLSDFRQQKAWYSGPCSELSLFDGEDLWTWIKKAEHFLRLTHSHPGHKARVISDYMTDKVWNYYEWIAEKEANLKWENLMEQRYGPRAIESAQGYSFTNSVPFCGQTSNTSQSNSLICPASADQKGFLNKPLPPTTTAPSPSLSPGDGGAPRGAITQAERIRRKEANLCYRCGNRWEPGHRCKSL